MIYANVYEGNKNLKTFTISTGWFSAFLAGRWQYNIEFNGCMLETEDQCSVVFKSNNT